MPPSLWLVTAEMMEWRRQDPERDLTPHIRALLLDWPDDDALILRGELISELQRQHRFEEALALLRAEIEREPGEPHHSLSLAEHFHYSDINLPESLVHVEHVVAKARVSETFMYQALGLRARHRHRDAGLAAFWKTR